MALTIRWTERASRQFDDIKAWIGETQGDDRLSGFVKQVFKIVDLLSEFPEMGMLEEKQKGIRGFLVSRHHRLFYRLLSNELIIIAVYDQRMDHRSRKPF